MVTSRGIRHIALGAAVVVAGVAVVGALAAAGNARSSDGDVPRVQLAPALTGIRVGTTLTVGNGTWASTTPVAFSVQWIRATSQATWAPIAGATGTTYTLAAADVGAQVFAQVKALNATGPNWANTQWTPVVVDPLLAGAVRLPDGQLSVQVAALALPDRLVLASVVPAPLTVKAGGTFALKVRVTDTRGNPVAGVGVGVTPLPFGVAAAPAKAATAADGTVTVQVGPLATGAVAAGQRLALYVTAAKPGDNALAGVGSARLVTVKVA